MISTRIFGVRQIFVGCILFGCSLAVACGGKSKPPLEPSGDSTASENDDGGGPSGFSENDDGGGGEGGADNAAILQGNADGAKALLAQFTAANADFVALTRALRPTSSDYKSLFDAATAAKVEAGQAKDWDSGKAVIKPKAGQTEIKIWGATGADLAAGKGDASQFPQAYKKIAKHMVATQLYFRFKFVEAGKDQGTGYDGLAFVNGHWVIAPKPWKAMEGKGSVGGDDDSSGDPAPKKKPKGKKK